jgi:hypothetical protein
MPEAGPYVVLTHRAGLVFRVDETNSVACGGKRGVSDTFASALWAVDALFSFARAGVDGVNIHVFPGAHYSLFQFGRAGENWTALVHREYYGLLLFARAAPPGARLLSVKVATANGGRGVTLAGQTFGTSTSSGSLAGQQRTLSLDTVAGGYVVSLPAASAALLTIPPG